MSIVYDTHNLLKLTCSAKLLYTLVIASSNYPVKCKRKKLFRPTSFPSMIYMLTIDFFSVRRQTIEETRMFKNEDYTNVMMCANYISLLRVQFKKIFV